MNRSTLRSVEGSEGAMRVWTDFQTSRESIDRIAVERVLARAGLEPIGEHQPRVGPGLLFFDTISPELCAFVRETSRDGLERVLAVGSSRVAFSSGSPWLLLSAGAADVFRWDHSADPATEIAARLRRWETVDALAASRLVQDMLVGRSPLWTRTVRQVVDVARFTDAAVLITGESGTGKELVARLIHALDARERKGELVVLDCTTVVPTLSGSEFFGHERGAFTGAVAARDGAFAAADGGTLFLDEIGDLPLPLQAELLRVIQEGMYKRVGSNVWRKTSFRLLCATNRDLLQETSEGHFRKDLYYRIAAWHCRLPSLREHAGDIPLLTHHFLSKARPGEAAPALDEAVAELLLTRAYPGNVRELRQLVARIVSRHEGPGPITVGDVPPEERPTGDWQGAAWHDERFEQGIRHALARGVTLRELSRVVGEIAIRIAVAEEGNLRRAAHRLGVTDRALQLRKAAGRTRSA
jgi:transcriptional regulator with GAF, ATPase, and Fis domain